MKNIKKLFYFLFTICCTFSNFSQNNFERTKLATVFNTIEKKSTVTFSYEDAILENHFLDKKLPNSLEEILAFLDEETLFTYHKLQDNTIAVRQKDNLKTMCLVIIDEFTNQPIANVLVATKYQTILSTNQGTVTILSSNMQEEVTVNKPNYVAQTVSVSSGKSGICTEILLLRKIEILETVLLTNYLTRGINKENNGAITINYKEFDILPGLIETDVLQTLQALPGVQSVNETVSFLNIRGGTNDQNLILWDGIKMYQSGHFFGLISAFNPQLTQKATLIKNGSSSIYGDGVSGIIAMESSQEKKDSIYGSAGFNLINGDVYAGFPIGKRIAVEISARKSLNNLIETPTYSRYFEKVFQNSEVTTSSDLQSTSNNDFSFFDTSLKLDYQISAKDQLRFNFLLIDNNLNFLENATIDNIALSRESRLIQNNMSGGIFHRRKWNNSITTETQLYGSNYRLEATNVDILNSQVLLQRNEVLENGIKTLTRLKSSKAIETTIGYQYNETGITNFEQINNPFFEITDTQVLRTNSFFSDIDWQSKNNKTTASAGVRVNHISKFNKVLVEPRVRFNHNFLEFFSFQLLGELKSQTTSQIIDLQNDFLGVENRKWVVSNPFQNIPIIKGQQISAGFTYSRKGLLVNVEPFLKHVDGITSQSQGFQNQFETLRTTGSYYVRGVEMLFNKQFRRVNTWFSYTYAKNTYDFEEVVPSVFHNNLDIRHSLTYGINYSWNNFKFSGGVNWHSGKPTTLLVSENEIVNEELNFETANTSNLPVYLRVDVSAIFDFKFSEKIKARAGFSIWNLLDRTNTYNQFFRINHSNNIESVNQIALGFTPNFTFRVSF